MVAILLGIWNYRHAFFKSVEAANDNDGTGSPSFVYVIVIVLFYFAYHLV